jgi:hypothetical protein
MLETYLILNSSLLYDDIKYIFTYKIIINEYLNTTNLIDVLFRFKKEIFLFNIDIIKEYT